MGVEIERKFKIRDPSWRPPGIGKTICQGYLNTSPGQTVRVRISEPEAWLTVKGLASGAVRKEFEYPIPLVDAREMLALCMGFLIEKKRFLVKEGDFVWEVDVFEGENLGLIVAEIELNSIEQDVPLPAWIGEELTGDPRYTNASLAMTPFSRWPLDKTNALPRKRK